MHYKSAGAAVIESFDRKLRDYCFLIKILGQFPYLFG